MTIPTEVFLWFPSVPPHKFWDNLPLGHYHFLPQPFHSLFSTTWSFDAIPSELLTTLLNVQQFIFQVENIKKRSLKRQRHDWDNNIQMDPRKKGCKIKN